MLLSIQKSNVVKKLLLLHANFILHPIYYQSVDKNTNFIFSCRASYILKGVCATCQMVCFNMGRACEMRQWQNRCQRKVC